MLKHRSIDANARRAYSFAAGMCLLLGALLQSQVSNAAEVAFDQVSRDFAERFERVLAKRDVPGGAFAIVHRGQILGLGTYGHTDQSDAQPIDASTRFRIASLSKGFSGVLAATLAAEQRFSLEQPVSAFAPSFRIKPQPRPLTVEDVLGQRSGYVRNAYDNLLEAGISRAEILPRFSTLEPLCAPGKCYSYQNNVFSLVEDVIGKSGGQPYSLALQKRIFEPLGMVGASVGYHAFISAENHAQPHLKTRSGWRESRPRTTYYQVPSAAGINAGIVDMAQWIIALLGHRSDVISPQVIDDVLTPRIRTANEMRNRNWRDLLQNAWYGLGWRIYQLPETRLALHGGWVAGYRAEIAFSREFDLGIVILSNAETRAIGELNREFWDLALDAVRLAASPPGGAVAVGQSDAGAASRLRTPGNY